MSKYYKKQLKNRDESLALVKQHYRFALHNKEQSHCINSRMNEVRNSKEFRSLNTYNKGWIEGIMRHLGEEYMNNNTVFAYCMPNGKIYPIDSKPYKRLSPKKVCETSIWRGFVYKNDNSKVYFSGKGNK